MSNFCEGCYQRETSIGRLEAELSELKRQLESTKAEAKELYLRLKNSTERAEQLKLELADAQETIRMKSGTIELWKAENAELVNKISAMYNEYVKVVHNISAEREVLKSENKELKDRVLELEDENHYLKTVVKKQERQIEAGDLVPAEVVETWAEQFGMSDYVYNEPSLGIKQYAAQMWKDGK